VIELVKKLTEAWGPSGYEHGIRELIKAEIQDLADEITVDPLGNMIARIGDGGKKVLIASHMDEIGVMATFKERNTGYFRFANIGGLNPKTLLGNRVKFENGTIGVIGVEGGGGNDLNDFYIDVDNGEGNELVQEGSPAGFWRTMDVRGNRLVGKAMDDRIGCVVAIEALRNLSQLRDKLNNTVYFAFTVQEEVGLRGARTVAFPINPDVAIALDVTRTGDEIKGAKMTVQLGGGAAIKVHDPGLVVPPQVVKWMADRAEADGIAYQKELLAGGTTDASAIQISGAGVVSGCISIPCRFIHTVSETVDTRDVQACIDLLTGLVSNPIEL
jgi:putative aminopeptidase FrvX